MTGVENRAQLVMYALKNRCHIYHQAFLGIALKHINYRIYRSTSPITSVSGLTPIITVGVLTGWDDEYYGRKNSNINNQPCPCFKTSCDGCADGFLSGYPVPEG